MWVLKLFQYTQSPLLSLEHTQMGGFFFGVTLGFAGAFGLLAFLAWYGGKRANVSREAVARFFEGAALLLQKKPEPPLLTKREIWAQGRLDDTHRVIQPRDADGGDGGADGHARGAERGAGQPGGAGVSGHHRREPGRHRGHVAQEHDLPGAEGKKP